MPWSRDASIRSKDTSWCSIECARRRDPNHWHAGAARLLSMGLGQAVRCSLSEVLVLVGEPPEQSDLAVDQRERLVDIGPTYPAPGQCHSKVGPGLLGASSRDPEEP